jgi:hypothetical protein
MLLDLFQPFSGFLICESSLFLCFLYKLVCSISIVCELFLFPMVTSSQFELRIFVKPSPMLDC